MWQHTNVHAAFFFSTTIKPNQSENFDISTPGPIWSDLNEGTLKKDKIK